MNNEIKRSWFFTQSVEEVWEFLTVAENIEKWLMPNNFVLEVNHEFTFTTNAIPDLGLDGTFYCKVLEIVLHKKLVYSWKGGLSKSSPSLDTIVEWTLHSSEKGTELKLIHTGFKEENKIIHNAMYHGWDEHIQKMTKNLNSN